jgi:hypothetical protein
MKPIGLTGNPTTQGEVGVELAELTTKRNMSLRLFIGVKTAAEAYHIHHEGGEIWHCGTEAPPRELLGQVDRVLPATTPAERGVNVIESLVAMLAKTPINGELACK